LATDVASQTELPVHFTVALQVKPSVQDAFIETDHMNVQQTANLTNSVEIQTDSDIGNTVSATDQGDSDEAITMDLAIVEMCTAVQTESELKDTVAVQTDTINCKTETVQTECTESEQTLWDKIMTGGEYKNFF